MRRSGPSDLPRSVENCQDLSRWSDGMPSASAEAKVQRPKDNQQRPLTCGAARRRAPSRIKWRQAEAASRERHRQLITELCHFGAKLRNIRFRGHVDLTGGDLMNSNFWVVIATAAPVVVLTCIVLCSTQGGNLAQLFHEWKTRHHPVILASIIAAAVVNLGVFSAEATPSLMPRAPRGEHGREHGTGYFHADGVPYRARRLLGGHACSAVHLVAGEGSGTEFSSAWRRHLPADHDQLTLNIKARHWYSR